MKDEKEALGAGREARGEHWADAPLREVAARRSSGEPGWATPPDAPRRATRHPSPVPLPPAWHGEAAAELNRDFVEIDALEMTARKRRAYLGLKFHYVKDRGKLDGSIPHGQFEDWMKRHCPAIPYRTYQRYMNEAKSLCERMGVQIRQIGAFEIPPHKLLELPAAQVPATEQKMQQLLLDLVEARGQFEPVTEYKRVDEHGQTKPGALKGSPGCTKEMRLQAQKWIDPLREIENDLISITDENDLTLGEVDSGRLSRFEAALRGCLTRVCSVLKSRRGQKSETENRNPRP